MDAILSETDEKNVLPLENAAVIWYNKEKKRERRADDMKDWMRIAAAVMLVAVLAGSLIYGVARRSPEGPEAVFLDVGEGSATLIRTAAGSILVDAGPENTQEKLVAHLKQLGVRELALLVLTHPDEDHIGGADGILRAFPTREVWSNGEPAESDSYLAFLRAAEAVGLPVQVVSAGEGREIGGVAVTVLSPAAESTGTQSENENGLVLLVEAAGRRLLLMGDAGRETEARLLTAMPDGLHADILLAGHHGSDSAGSEAFLAAVAPETIVISCGAGNASGHPDGRALERMRAVCGDIRRTDLAGDIRIGLSEKTER